MEEPAVYGGVETPFAPQSPAERGIPDTHEKSPPPRPKSRPARRVEPEPATPDALPFLPYAKHVIDEADIAAVVAILRSNNLTQGPAVSAFEQALAKRCGASRAVALNSGTAALFVTARALALGPGTVTIVPAITFLATANAVTLNGGSVVFADVDPISGLMTPETLLAALRTEQGQRAKAAIPVHYGGVMADMEPLAEIARKHGLLLIEDAAHAIGSSTTDRNGAAWQAGACQHSIATCFSFHPAKTIAAGEAGAILTKDEVLAQRLERDRNHGVTRKPGEMTEADVSFDHEGQPNPWSYEMDRPSLNFRLSDLHAALGLSQLGKIGMFKERRKSLLAAYRAQLAPLYPMVQVLEPGEGQDPAWHLCSLRIRFDALGVTRARTMRALASQGIQTQVHYIPLHFQPYYRHLQPDLSLPGAETFYRRALSLPLHAGMTELDVTRTVGALRSALRL